MKPTIAVMIGGKPGKDHGPSEPAPDSDDEGMSEGGEEDTVKEELGTAVAEALASKDPKALYQAICDIVRYERE